MCLGDGYPSVPHGTDLMIARATVAIDLAGCHDAGGYGVWRLICWEIKICWPASAYSHADVISNCQQFNGKSDHDAGSLRKLSPSVATRRKAEGEKPGMFTKSLDEKVVVVVVRR